MFKKSLLIALVLFGSLFSQMTEKCFADAASQLEQAKSYEDAGQYAEALEAYENIIQEYPGTEEALEALFRTGFIKEQQQQYTQAETIYQQIIGQYPNTDHALESLCRRGLVNELQSKYEQAVSIYQQVIAQYPGRMPHAMDALFRTGRIKEQQQQYTQAESIFQQVIAQYPGSLPYTLEALFRTAVIKEEQQGYDQAQGIYQQVIQECNEVVEQYPGNADFAAPALYILGSISLQRGRCEEAKSIYQQVVQQYPGSELSRTAELWTQTCQILLFINEGNDTAAQAGTDSLIADFGDHAELGDALFWTADYYYIRALQLEKAGSVDQAHSSLEKAIARWEIVINEFSDSALVPSACCFEGECYRILSDYQKSVQYYQKVVDDYPEYSLAWHAQFLVGHLNQDLAKAGLISQVDADVKTKSAYQQLLENYPDCKAAKAANNWLKRNN